MSEASRAKSAKARATIAARMIMAHKPSNGFPRSFDDCFEMNDGTEVVAELLRRAESKPEFKAALVANGFGYWLVPGYIDKFTQKKAGAA